MKKAVVVTCKACGCKTADVYYRSPGTGEPLAWPLCVECYERGWERYWREKIPQEKKGRAKAIRTWEFLR